ncbi:MAG: hypothetical protein WCI03_09320 [bacterium]
MKHEPVDGLAALRERAAGHEPHMVVGYPRVAEILVSGAGHEFRRPRVAQAGIHQLQYPGNLPVLRLRPLLLHH